MPISPPAARLRANIGNAALRGDQQAADENRRDLRAVTAEEYITRLLATAPPLTADQRDRLALLLRGGGPDAAA